MTLRLWERLKIELEKQDLWNIWDLETSLIPMMCDMRQLGVRVDLGQGRSSQDSTQSQGQRTEGRDPPTDKDQDRTMGGCICSCGVRGARTEVP